MSQKDLLIRCRHNIGCFKYIVVERKSDRELLPLRVYLNEVQANATPYDNDIVNVSTKYKVSRCGKTKWVKEEEIYDTEEQALKTLKK